MSEYVLRQKVAKLLLLAKKYGVDVLNGVDVAAQGMSRSSSGVSAISMRTKGKRKPKQLQRH